MGDPIADGRQERGRGTEGKEHISRPTINRSSSTSTQLSSTRALICRSPKVVCVANWCSSHNQYISVVGKGSSLIRVFYRVNGCFTSCSPNMQFKDVLSGYLALLITLAAPPAINLVCNHTRQTCTGKPLLLRTMK